MLICIYADVCCNCTSRSVGELGLMLLMSSDGIRPSKSPPKSPKLLLIRLNTPRIAFSRRVNIRAPLLNLHLPPRQTDSFRRFSICCPADVLLTPLIPVGNITPPLSALVGDLMDSGSAREGHKSTVYGSDSFLTSTMETWSRAEAQNTNTLVLVEATEAP